MAYNRFNDDLESPIFVNAKVRRSVFGFAVPIYTKEILAIFPPKGVHFCWTFKQD